MKIAGKVLAGLMVAAMASQALANLHYFTQNSTLYSWSGAGAPSTVGISDGGNYPGLGIAPNGDLWGSNSNDRAFYTINPATGVSSKIFDYQDLGVSGNIISFDFREVNGQLQVFGMAGDKLHVFEENAGNWSKKSTVSVGGGSNYPSTGYDPSTGTYYGTRSADRKVYKLGFGGTKSDAQLITENGSTLTWDLAGGAWYNGTYFAGVHQNGTVRLGTLDPSSGAWAPLAGGSFALGNAGSMGYAVTAIPVPGAALLGVIGLGLVRAFKRR